MEADTKTTSSNGPTTPPVPTAYPLVYITGPFSSNKKCVAECVATILGDDKAVLIDHPYPISISPPPPSSTPPPPSTPAQHQHQQQQPCTPSSARPLAPKQHASYSRAVRPTGLRIPSIASTRKRSASTPGPPCPFSDPLLTTLYQNPTRAAILTDCDARVKAIDAATTTGRMLLSVQLLDRGQTNIASASDLLTLRLPISDPHGTALTIVEFVNNETGKRRASEASEWWGMSSPNGCVCGVITPAMTPAEEKEEIKF